MAIRITIEEVLALSAVSQRLTGVVPAGSLHETVDAIGGLAAGLNHVPFLSLSARMPDFDPGSLQDDQQSERPGLLRTAGARAGFILAPVERIPALARLASSTGAAESEEAVTSLADEQITAAVSWISASLRQGSKTYPELRQGAPEAILRQVERGTERALHQETALQGVLVALERRGDLVSTLGGGINTSEGPYRYCLRSRMTSAPLPAVEGAYVQIADWYLHAYGPAGPRDFSAWSGLSEAACRRATGGIAAPLRIVEAPGMGEDLLVPASILDRPPLDAPVCFLIPWLDGWLHAYSGVDRFSPEGRESTLAPRDLALVSVGPGIRQDQTLAARVRLVGSAREPRIQTEPWRPLAQHESEALDAGVARVAGFFGKG